MRRLILGIALAAAIAPIASVAQTAAPAAPAPDPARLAAAHALIDILMPPATREQMIQGMMTPMLANMRRGMMENPTFAGSLGDNPKVKAAFDRFMEQQHARTIETMRASLPGMADAMARAYARRFDLRQLGDIRTFFETPTGRAYMQASFTIMNDPDIAAWQRTMMAETMGHVQEDVATFAKDVTAIQQDEKKP